MRYSRKEQFIGTNPHCDGERVTDAPIIADIHTRLRSIYTCVCRSKILRDSGGRSIAGGDRSETAASPPTDGAAHPDGVISNPGGMWMPQQMN